MSTLLAESRITFDDLHEHLFDQFIDPPFENRTGLSAEALEAEVESFIDSNPLMPKVLLKANAFRIIVTRGQICVDPYDWFADKLNHGGILRKIARRWLDFSVEGPLAETAGWLDDAYATGLLKGPKAGLDLGHIAPGWESMLSTGIDGLLSQVRSRRSQDSQELSLDERAFLDAVEIVYESTIALSNRFADLCEQMSEQQPNHSSRLQIVASACRRVPEHSPTSFHEALQFTWIMHELIEMEGEFVRSMGQFDRHFYQYYRRDIEQGRLAPEEAKELIKFYWMKWYSRTRGKHNGKNFVFGGQYPDGTQVTNELTYIALEAYEEFKAPDPKLSVRYLSDTDERLYRRVADLIRRGHNSFVLLNDEVAVRALEKRGKTPRDARFYLPIGCYEPAVEGREAACTMNVTVNLAKPVELLLNDGKDTVTGKQIGAATGSPESFSTFDEVWKAYVQQLDAALTHAIGCIQAAEGQWPQINPSPLIAGTIEDCIETAKDIGQGGPRYNSVGFVGAGLANAVDSLLAIEWAVFRDRRYTMKEVLTALDANFSGFEEMRQYLIMAVPKWGNNDDQSDAVGKHITDFFSQTVHSFTNGRGGGCQAALFTLEFAWYGGKRTGALPDGRKSGEPLAPGTGATYGRDRHGVTALSCSVQTIDAENLPNGSVLDVTLHPSTVAGEKGLDTMVNLIKTHFAGGGYGLQFNIYDVETLRDAQHNPEKYAGLQVRLTGWSVYFTTLSPFEQEQFINRIAHR
ncbi:MAG: hypothetical protein CMN78_00105 [Spirochaetales bacterium]|nr:hypothetical protein [Spirochaetales bacterium]